MFTVHKVRATLCDWRNLTNIRAMLLQGDGVEDCAHSTVIKHGEICSGGSPPFPYLSTISLPKCSVPLRAGS